MISLFSIHIYIARCIVVLVFWRSKMPLSTARANFQQYPERPKPGRPGWHVLYVYGAIRIEGLTGCARDVPQRVRANFVVFRRHTTTTETMRSLPGLHHFSYHQEL